MRSSSNWISERIAQAGRIIFFGITRVSRSLKFTAEYRNVFTSRCRNLHRGYWSRPKTFRVHDQNKSH
jgi:hypothetical protein